MTVSRPLPLLASAPNFRDMGGLPAADGRTLRYGQLYRSEDFSNLSDRDAVLLQNLGVQLLCDVRSDSERRQHPNRWPTDPVGTLNLNIAADLRASHAAITRLLSGTPGVAEAEQAMLVTYRMFPEAFTLRLAQLFGRILAGGQLPLVFHCAAGKDRTGFIAAILLSALGVEREAIYADYLLSLERWQGERSEAAIRRYLQPLCDQEPAQDVIQTLCQVQAIYLDAAFEEIEQRYGGVNDYLQLIGLHASAQDRLQALLLA
ncbi:MAG: tyrosine-protein phosphatase [Pseudomonas sp.]|uniref:tyrosine-protein phosphatase n=1 Tax=Pseudomonas sp. TaxID=306 RepID=UPI0030F15A9D